MNIRFRNKSLDGDKLILNFGVSGLRLKNDLVMGAMPDFYRFIWQYYPETDKWELIDIETSYYGVSQLLKSKKQQEQDNLE